MPPACRLRCGCLTRECEQRHVSDGGTYDADKCQQTIDSDNSPPLQCAAPSRLPGKPASTMHLEEQYHCRSGFYYALRNDAGIYWQQATAPAIKTATKTNRTRLIEQFAGRIVYILPVKIWCPPPKEEQVSRIIQNKIITKAISKVAPITRGRTDG